MPSKHTFAALILTPSLLLGVTLLSAADEKSPKSAASQPASAPAGKPADARHPRVRLKTNMGDIVVELDGEKAPITTENFLQYVRDGHYDGTICHRAIMNFMIQLGGFDQQLKEKPTRDGIKNEWKNGLKNARGTVAMARKPGQPDSATAQIFINLRDNINLDRAGPDGAGYAVFGKVVEGMDVVDKIAGLPMKLESRVGTERAFPLQMVTIEKAIIE